MSVKAILVLCAQALVIQTTVGQTILGLNAPCGLAAPALATPCALGAPSWAASSLASPYGLAGAGFAGLGWPYDSVYGNTIEFSPTSGGALPVTSASGIAPVGISVASDNVYEGILAVAGELPFVGTVGMEGVVPSAGAGAVNHACGNGRNAMISDTAAFSPTAALAPFGAYGPAAIVPAAAYGASGAYGLGAAYAPGLAALAPGPCYVHGDHVHCGCGIYYPN